MWPLLLDLTRAKWANKQWLLSLEISTRKRGEMLAAGGAGLFFLSFPLLLPVLCLTDRGRVAVVKGQLMVTHKWWNDSERDGERWGERAVISRSRPFGRLDWQAVSPASSYSVEQRGDEAELSLSPAIWLSPLSLSLCLCLDLFSTLRYNSTYKQRGRWTLLQWVQMQTVYCILTATGVSSVSTLRVEVSQEIRFRPKTFEVMLL